MSLGNQVSTNRYQWAAPGDVNAFFGLMLDNIAGLVLMVTMLAVGFGFPTSFALGHMVPGTAIGVLVGDLIFFWIAIRVARRTGRNDVTAMPLGLDTPSTVGMVLFVLGPAFLAAKRELGIDGEDPDHALLEKAAIATWHIGICSIFISGLFKFACAISSNWIRRVVPRAGLLGSLAAIALVLITFSPLLETLDNPVVGLIALAIILTTLVARVPLPGRIPGTLGALLISTGIYYLMAGTGLIHHDWKQLETASQALFPHDWLTVFSFQWITALDDVIIYLPIVIPFALGTVVGGIDCTESAAAAGDEYDTNQVIGVEAFATLVASVCGGVIQTTPYIGHPAYKAMGGRAAYTLATALFVGGAGVLGYFGFLYAIIPKSTVYPILVFIGIEITAQSFHATKSKHYPAVALACLPALAMLAKIFATEGLGATPIGQSGKENLETVLILSNGFIITSLLWASSLAAIIDRRMWTGATYFAITAAFSLFGVIHSPLQDGRMFFPHELPSLLEAQGMGEHLWRVPYEYSAGYLGVALILLVLGAWQQTMGLPETKEPNP